MDGRCVTSRTTDWSLSLIIPAYNEEATIRQAVAEADRALAALAGEYEILVVDDGSRDGTARVVLDEARVRPRVRLLRHEGNRGYGAALRTGFEAARLDRVAFTDADCQFHLDDLALLLPLTEEVPIAVGYRVDRKDPWKRRFFSWGYNTMVRTLLGTRVRDCDCALKVFRRDALTELLPEARGFFVNTEILTRARQKDLEVAEVGVRHRPRFDGESKVALRDIPRTLATLLPFWWSQVLFPGQSGDSSPAGGAQTSALHPPSSILYPLFLLCVAGLLFFSRLGCPLQEPEESRYAEIPRQMLEVGNLCVPVLHGQPYLDKPPLLYWLVMGCYRLLGVHDWVTRLVPGAVGVLTVLATYWWGKRTVGSRAAFLGAMILCLSVRFVQLSRLVTLNGLLCLCVVAALAAAHVAIHRPSLRWRYWLLSAMLCGLGLLTKGPVSLVLVLVPVFVCARMDPRTARLGGPAWLAYVGVAVGVASPWFLAVSTRIPDFIEYFFWKHHVVRFLAPFDHEEPAWFFLPGLFAGMLPWSLLLLPMARFLADKSAEAGAERPAALGFFLISSLWGLLFFSLAGSKRAGYILPAMPPLALALGYFLNLLLGPGAQRVSAGRPTLTPAEWGYRLTGLVLVAGLAASVAATGAGLLDPRSGAMLVALILLGLVGLVGVGASPNATVSWTLCGATTLILLLLATHWLLPGYARRFSMRGMLRPQLAQGISPETPVLCYPRRWDSVSFYLRRSDVQVFRRDQREQLIDALRCRPETVLVVKSDRSLRDLLRDLPGSLDFEVRGRRGNVTVGRVRPRLEAPPGLLVQGRETVPKGW